MRNKRASRHACETLGGDGDEFSRGVAVDAAGNAHIVGLTNSRNFPVVPGALRTRSTLFKSIDGGVKWSNDNYGIDYGFNSAITSLIVHPTLPSTIYAAFLLIALLPATTSGRRPPQFPVLRWSQQRSASTSPA